MDLSTGKRRRYDIASLIGDCHSNEQRHDVSTNNDRQPSPQRQQLGE